MKILKQPWFLILVAAASIYTYQFYSESGALTVGLNEAQAAQNVKEEKQDQEKERMSVKLSETFSVKKVSQFKLSSYLPLKIRMNNTSGDDLIVSLLGEGDQYKNNGDKLSDWFDVSLKEKVLTLKSPNKKEKGLSSMKDLAEKLSGNEERSLTLIIEFPQKYKFEDITMEVVTADLTADGLNFEKLNLTNVSGDTVIKNSQGDLVNVESVSGDSNLQIKGLRKAHFTSVSGDTILRSENKNPEIDFESVSGDLSLEFPSESQVEVKFNSMTGELTNDFGTSKGEGKKVNFSSLSGDAKISKIQKSL